MKRHLFIAVCVLAGTTTSFSAAADEDLGWSGEGSGGFVSARGNTDTTTVTAGIAAKYNTPTWRYTMGFSALTAEEDGEQNAERWEVSGQADRKFSETSYVFGSARYLDDSFGAFETQASFAAGYGRELFKTEKHNLNGEVGLGYRTSEECAASDLNGECIQTGDSLDEFIMVGKLNYSWAINANTTLTDGFSVEIGEDNTYAQNETALNVKMGQSLSLKLSWILRHNTDVPVDTKNTDTLTTVSVVYGF